MASDRVKSFEIPMREDLIGDPVQVIAHALAEATLKGRGVELTEASVSIEKSHHFSQAIEIVSVFPWYNPENADLLRCVSHIESALCNYVNGCSDPFEPVSVWDEESKRNFRELCRAYNAWYTESKRGKG